MAEEVRHINVEQRYKVQFERSATKGVIGYKVESNGDNLETAFEDANTLMIRAEHVTPAVEQIKEVK